VSLNAKKLEDDLFSALKSAFKFSEIPEGDEKDAAEKSYQDLAGKITDAIDSYVRGGDVSVTASVPVTLADGVTTQKVVSKGSMS
jgi:hypothetical protein